jgi:hypothetical protein
MDARLDRAAALVAAFVVGASGALAGPVLAQTVPSPDPDPKIQPDPIPTSRSKVTTTPRPAVRSPASSSAPAAGQPTPLAQQPTAASRPSPAHTSKTGRSARRSRPASKPHRTQTRHRQPATAQRAWERLSSLTAEQPFSAALGGGQADDRSQARALSLAAIALLLVVIAGGSALRLTARLPNDVQRGRPA